MTTHKLPGPTDSFSSQCNKADGSALGQRLGMSRRCRRRAIGGASVASASSREATSTTSCTASPDVRLGDNKQMECAGVVDCRWG